MKIFVSNIYLGVIVFLTFLPIISHAQGNSPIPCDAPGSGKLCNPIDVDSIPELIRIILEAVLKIGIPIIALAIIYSGFLFVAAQGNDEKLSTAKRALTYTLIGAAILLGSWAIAKLISETVLEISSNYLILIS